MTPQRDTTPDPGGERVPRWTVDSLMALMDERDRRYAERFEAQQTAVKDALAAQERAVAAALNAADRAVAKAEAASERRFEGVNEFRATLADQASRLMPRNESEARFNALDARVTAISAYMERQQGAQTGTKDSWGYLIGFVGLLATIGGIVGLIVGLTS